MIQLFANEHELDLPPGLQLQRELETSIFRRNGEATDFVYPVDLPLTDKNKVALLLPDVLAKTFHHNQHAVFIVVDGIQTRGVLYIENVSLANRTVRVSISGDYGGFWKEAQDIKVSDLELGGIRTVGTIDTGATDDEQVYPNVFVEYTPCTTGAHIEDVMDGTTVTDYLFYPAVDEKLNIPILHEKHPNSEGSAPEMRNLLNFYYYNNSGDKGVLDPMRAYIELAFTTGWAKKCHERYFWVPFFRLSFVLKKCFTDLNFTVIGDIFSSSVFDKITLYNTYAINRCSVSEAIVGADRVISVVHEATEIDPRNHVPKMTVTEFLKEIAKTFNLQYNINYATREVVVNMVGEFDGSVNPVIDITSKVNPLAELSLVDFQPANGYHLEFENDSYDGALFEKLINTLDGLNNIGSVGAWGGLSALSPADLDIAYVKAENAWYQYHASAATWYFAGYHFKYIKTTNAEDLQQVITKAVPVPMSRFYFLGRMSSQTTNFLDPANFITTTENDYLMPYSKMGIAGTGLLTINLNVLLSAPSSAYEGCITISKATVESVNPHLCSYIGFSYPRYSASTATHPCGTSTSYDAKGNTVTTFKLNWSDPAGDGLYKDWWKNYTEQLIGSVVAEYEMIWDTDTYRDIDLQSSFLQISSLLFLCDKANIVFPFPSVGKIRLVRFG